MNSNRNIILFLKHPCSHLLNSQQWKKLTAQLTAHKNSQLRVMSTAFMNYPYFR